VYDRIINVPNLPPRVVGQYLMQNEGVVITVRMHPAAIIGPALLILLGLIGAGFLTGYEHAHGAFVAVVWILFGVLFAWQGWRVLTWWRRYFVVTENRLMLVTSLLDTDVGMMPLAKVTDMRLHQTTTGRAFGYAEFIVESAGQDQALSHVRFVPYPAQMYQEILNLIFPKKQATTGSQGSQGPPGPPGPPGPAGPTWPGGGPPERPGDDPGF
jgi:hypothetical protein